MTIDTCIICGSSDNLNTTMTILVDDQKIDVKLCQEHSDDVTPRQAREAYAKKKEEIDEILAKAKQFGLELAPSSGKIATFNKQPAPAPAIEDNKPVPELNGELLDTAIVDAVLERKVQGIGGTVSSDYGSQVLQANNAYDIGNFGTDKLPAEVRRGKVKMAIAEGRCGQPMAIPEVRRDGTGTTVLRVVKGGGDAELQRRFKSHAGSVDSDGANTHAFSSGGYAVRDCPFCRGEGRIKIGEDKYQECPKCDGSGIFGTA